MKCKKIITNLPSAEFVQRVKKVKGLVDLDETAQSYKIEIGP